MIELIDVSKSFPSSNGKVNAVKDVNINIKKSEVFGIIGYSGAGKSTLVRCINLLERPTTGKVLIEGVDLVPLKERELRLKRQKMGMIFQQFNLLSSRTVFENVAFPLRYKGLKEKEIEEKVISLLDLVGIRDKAYDYPSQLSGGQKQRVAIGRALANDPDVLLCDEATSALDPQTTKSILKLLKDLNEKLGITIVIITHEMNVIKEICHRVAVMEDGYVVELNDVVSIFLNPKSRITKDFINATSNLSGIEELLKHKPQFLELKEDQLLCKLDFYGDSTKEAIISNISKKYDVEASIIFGNLEIISETILGSLIIIITGSERKQKSIIEYLNTKEIKVEVIEHDGFINEVHA